MWLPSDGLGVLRMTMGRAATQSLSSWQGGAKGDSRSSEFPRQLLRSASKCSCNAMHPSFLLSLHQDKSRESLEEMDGLYVRRSGSLDHFTALRSLYLRQATNSNIAPKHPLLPAGLRRGAARALIQLCCRGVLSHNTW